VLYFTASYSVTYLLVGALGVLTLLVVLLLPDADQPVSETKTLSARTTEFRQGLAEVLRTPPIFVAAGIEAVMYLGYGAFLGFLRGSSAIRKFRSAAFADAPKDQWREPPPLPLLQGHRRPGRGDLQGARPAPPTRIPLPQPGCLVQRLSPMTLRFGLRRPLAPPHGGPKQGGLPHRPSPSLRRGTLTRLARRRLV
jgi:hypothetical protein